MKFSFDEALQMRKNPFKKNLFKKKVTRSAAVALLLGTATFFNGCLSVDFFKRTLEATVTQTALEFLLDNDAVIDLFEDGATGLNP